MGLPESGAEPPSASGLSATLAFRARELARLREGVVDRAALLVGQLRAGYRRTVDLALAMARAAWRGVMRPIERVVQRARSWAAGVAASRRAERRRELRRRLKREAERLAQRADRRRLREIEAAFASLTLEHAQLERFAQRLVADDSDSVPDPASFVAQLRGAFPTDRFEVRRRTATSVDIAQTVHDRGAPIGVVLHRLSDEAWRAAVLRDAKRSAARLHAGVVVVTSRSLPKSVRQLTARDGVVVGRPALALPLAQVARRLVADIHADVLARQRAAERARSVAAASSSLAGIGLRLRLAPVRAARSFARLAGGLASQRRAAPPAPPVAVPSPEAPAVEVLLREPPPEVAPPPVALSAKAQELEALILGSSDPLERALLLEERAQERIAAHDGAASAVVLEAVEALHAQEMRLAATDLLLQWIATGAPDRDAQLALLMLEREMGLTGTAEDRCRLLAEVLRLEGRADRATEVEALA